ncbi:prepilin-type N-terminal cleavage/methylation domain-containing protein [Candidatus Magnetobacterium casense]|uniref:Prepilin-type N-terminal cleavage/methylation domain-containing protein n=1 Tax=Candidatus Magnetobacterium casense TaxID=1455061 RepID=A0ABS6S362_9BACT|nr:prepilin-type N-terminal cleavage/methylation domain-containing protein [Candidatus Magnetobacterium casensis]MBV6343276.1 prepilin-type N-terminal cleavage/methylation domain-containing protein [Candidatus Magnetobacterium casensis]
MREKMKIVHDNKGFTLIEMIVVLVVVSIIVGLMVSQFTGTTTKIQIEAGIKKMYGDLMEAKSKSYAERKTYGLYWSAPSAIEGYELRVDTDNDGSITNSGGYSSVRTITVEKAAIINKEGVNSIPFAIKGSLDTATYGNIDATFYSECKACDHVTSGCDPEDPANTLCKPQDTTSDCSNIDYPEYSCIVVTLTRIKMGKWCNNVCQLR